MSQLNPPITDPHLEESAAERDKDELSNDVRNDWNPSEGP
jgi:hypothetical protein